MQQLRDSLNTKNKHLLSNISYKDNKLKILDSDFTLNPSSNNPHNQNYDARGPLVNNKYLLKLNLVSTDYTKIKRNSLIGRINNNEIQNVQSNHSLLNASVYNYLQNNPNAKIVNLGNGTTFINTNHFNSSKGSQTNSDKNSSKYPISKSFDASKSGRLVVLPFLR
jgi:hypothetical protein